LDSRLDSLNSIGRGSHAILVYESERERDEIISHYLEVKIEKRNCVNLLSSSPHKQIRHLKQSKRLSTALNDNSLFVDDVTVAFGKQQPHLHVTRKIRQMQELVNSGEFYEWSLIGDWVGTYYNRPEVLLKTEQILSNLEHSGRIVCCYRTTGLSGLGTTCLSRLVHFHGYLLFPRETFVVA
jgi:hypothetical protein